MDFNRWFKAAQRLDPNCLANEAFHLASRHPPTHSAPLPMTHSVPPCTPFSFLHSHPPSAATPAAMHTPSCALPPGIPMDVDCTQSLKPLAQTCYHCGQTSHISRDCDLHHHIHHMTLDEQDKFIQQIMANYKGTSARFLTFPLYSSTLLYSPLLIHTHPCSYVHSPTLCTITRCQTLNADDSWTSKTLTHTLVDYYCRRHPTLPLCSYL
jgi:hypothetical protein